MSNRPESARFSVSRDASTGRQHPRCSSVRPLPARASPLEPDQARRISAAGDRVARPCVRGSRTGSEGSETAAEGPLRWRLGSRRSRIGRGVEASLGEVSGRRADRRRSARAPAGPAGGVGGPPGVGGDLGLRARGARGCPSFTPALDLPLWLRGGPPLGGRGGVEMERDS